MTSFLFTVTLRGQGENESEAWTDAIEAFAADPGEPTTTEIEGDDEPELPILKFNTGRPYSDQGQRISATLLSDGRMAFVDHHRGIRGITKDKCPVTGSDNQRYWLMLQYDMNLYQDALRSEVPEAILEY